jgi:AcrR family transcriptional regulator
MNQPSRKERELALRQAIVFEAAEAVVAERGYHGASVDEIARRAEISVGTLYNLFGNKENLFACVTEKRVEEVRQAMRERAAAVGGGLEKLHAAVDAIFDHFDRHERSFRVWVNATQGLDWNILPQFGDRVFQAMRSVSDDFTALCRRGVREGSLPRLDAELLALSLLGTINSFVTRWVTERRSALAPYRRGVHAVLDAWSAGAGQRREPGRARP